MASRRMFSKNIISSASFIKMPPSSQSLYFHLALNADDDGVVEAFSIMRMIAASEDDLKILAAKKFVTILNDDLVTFVNDWTEHNIIRPDRKIDSKYKDLLLEVVANVKLIDKKPRSDISKCKVSENENVKNQEVKEKWTDNGRSMDGEMSAQGRVGKGRVGKESIYSLSTDGSQSVDDQDEDVKLKIENQKPRNHVPYEKIAELYQQILGAFLPSIKFINATRRKIIAARWNDQLPTIEDWDRFFKIIARSDFLCGKTQGREGKPFVATFDWLIKDANCIKILEFNYENAWRERE